MSNPPEPAEAIVTARCPHCGAGHPVREQVLGRLAKCTACEQRFVLRKEEPPAEPPPVTTPGPPAAAEHRPSAPSPPPPPVAPPTAPTAEAPEPPPFAPAPGLEAPPPFLAPPPARSAAEPAAFEVPPPPTPCRVLGLAARSAEVFAVVGLILGTLWCVVLMIVALAQVTDTAQLVATIATLGALWLWVVSGSVLLVLTAQWVRLGLHVERHTRETAAACRALATRPQAIQD